MILLAPDKFKGTLTAAEVAENITKALRQCDITDEIVILPMADGGEGTAEALTATPIDGMKGCYNIPGTADCLIVSSEIVGRSCFDMEQQAVTDRSSYDLGKAIIRLASDASVRHIYIAVGGTATSDGGAGLLQAMGARFTNQYGIIEQPLTPALLTSVTDIVLPQQQFEALRSRIIGLIDVHAALYTGEISALTFAPQKGATKSDITLIRNSLRNLSHLIGEHRNSDYDGAGGGIGYAIASAIGAPCLSGAEFILNNANLDWQNISLVITGEGSIDNQTGAGKVVNAICTAATKHNIPYLAIGGRVAEGITGSAYITTMLPGECPPASPHEAAFRLRRAVISRFSN